MNFIKRLFAKPTNYAPQVLSEKQLALVNEIDQTLVTLHSGSLAGEMKVCAQSIPLYSTVLSIDTLMSRLKLEVGDAYIPRSVAFINDFNGDWVFLYAIRCANGSDAITTTLFIDALGRTNNAR